MPADFCLRLVLTTTWNVDTMAVDENDFVSHRRHFAQHYCTLCGKAFRRKTELTRHVDGPHASPNTLMYSCRSAHYQTARKDNYMRHLAKCAMKRKSTSVFRCRCGIANDDESSFFAHIQKCRLTSSPLERMGCSFPPKIDVQPPPRKEAGSHQNFFRRTLSSHL